MLQGTQDMQRVKLVGNIAKFGDTWTTNCLNIREIFKLIECQTIGFKKHLAEAADAGVSYEIRRGKEIIQNEEELFLSLNDEDIVITEIPAGAGKGVGMILAGVVLVLLAPLAGPLAPFLVGIGGSLITSGLTSLLAPGIESDDARENEGYLFTGAENNVQQGFPVPVLYGQLRVGGAPISVVYEPYSSSSYSATPINSESTITENNSAPMTDPAFIPDDDPAVITIPGGTENTGSQNPIPDAHLGIRDFEDTRDFNEDFRFNLP